MRWVELSESEPRLVEVAHDRLIKPGVLLVATTRRDGTPRLSPVEPLIFEDDLWLSMMWQSHKAIDLLRDDRILIHSIITNREGSEGEVTVIRYAPSGDQHVARWPSREEFVRRETSATSVGAPEPNPDYFADQ